MAESHNRISTLHHPFGFENKYFAWKQRRNRFDQVEIIDQTHFKTTAGYTSRWVCAGRTSTIATFYIHSYKLNNNNKYMRSDALQLFRAKTKICTLNTFRHVQTCSNMFKHVGTQPPPECCLVDNVRRFVYCASYVCDDRIF